MSPIIPLTVSAFAFIATSATGPQPKVYYSKNYYFEEKAELIVERLEKQGCKCIDAGAYPPYKRCRIFVDNDTLKFSDINIYNEIDGVTIVQLNNIKYHESVFDTSDGDSLNLNSKDLLNKIFEREVVNRIIKNVP
jgi:hypothetical protein